AMPTRHYRRATFLNELCLPFRQRGDRRTALACRIAGADAEDDVVLRNRQGHRAVSRVGSGNRLMVLPVGRGGVAPHDVDMRLRRHTGTGLPAQGAVVVQVAGHNTHLLRCSRGGGEGRERGRVEPGHVRHVVEIDELEQIAVLLAVFETDVLVLVVEVLAPLCEANGGEALLIEGEMVAAAKKAVEPELEHRAES